MLISSVHITYVHHVYTNIICIHYLSASFVGSLKLQVFFAKEPYKRDDILQKRRKLRSCVSIMGWLRLVGSLKSEVSTVEEPYKREHILQKRPVILRSLHIVATPQLFTSTAHGHHLYTSCIHFIYTLKISFIHHVCTDMYTVYVYRVHYT